MSGQVASAARTEPGAARHPTSRGGDGFARFLSGAALLPDRLLFAAAGSFATPCLEVEFPAVDGATLRGWHLPGERRGTLVFCPGNSGNLSSHQPYVALARQSGFGVLGLDYRGFGRSSGRADLRHLVDDILAGARHARELSGAREPIALFGISIGAVAALAAAARVVGGGEGGDARVDGLIVEGTADLWGMLHGLLAQGRFGPTRVRSMAAPGSGYVPRVRRRFCPRLLPDLLARPAASEAVRVYPFEGKRPARVAAALGCLPTLIVHGAEDELLPFEASLDTFRELAGPRRLFLVPRTGHAQEPALTHGVEYARQIGDFLALAFGGSEDGSDAEARRRLVTVEGEDALLQRVLPPGAEPAVEELPSGLRLWEELPVHTLGDDGLPSRPDDPLSSAYREEGYRDGFRRLVAATNARDFGALDRDLHAYLELPRRMPFDLLASTYALRLAQASERRSYGWPRPEPEAARRALETYRDLWRAHEGWAETAREGSALDWVEGRLGDV